MSAAPDTSPPPQAPAAGAAPKPGLMDRMRGLFSRKKPAAGAAGAGAAAGKAPGPPNPARVYVRIGAAVLTLILLLYTGLGMWWSREPEPLDVDAVASAATLPDGTFIVGYTTVSMLIQVAETLLDKSGGYLTNDRFPPGIFLDNIPNWEYGALVQVRDLSRALRKDISRNQTQSTEDQDLVMAEQSFHSPNNSWVIPASENQYRIAIDALKSYQSRLRDPDDTTVYFYTRTDSLRAYLNEVERRLGSISQRLTAAVATQRSAPLAGVDNGQGMNQGDQVMLRTPWNQIDDIFYEARGASWALWHIFQGMQVDYGDMLVAKGATQNWHQMLQELESTQQPVWAPVILNGGGFGLMANHSLVMSTYITRAKGLIVEMENQIQQN